MPPLKLIPRFTLFSGTNCPLCDVAKFELNRVRQTRQFQLDTIDIHAPGNAAWKKKYVYWIPALHLDGQEIAKGRWDATDPPPLPFFTESFPTHQGWWEPSGLYTRHTADSASDDVHALGDAPEPAPDLWAQTGPRCFNCASTAHVLSACPRPLDKVLVALSRSIYEFERGGGGAPRSLRELAERLERAAWAGSGGGGFVPGRVEPALRVALRSLGGEYPAAEGEDDGRGYGWLANMAEWGYPPGWVSATDPRERMRARIMYERDPAEGHTAEGEEEEEEDVMKIWGEDGEESLLLSAPPRHDEQPQLADSDGASNEEAAEDGEIRDNKPQLKRWARYPDTHFAWDRLTVYNGARLSERWRDLLPPPSPPPPPPPEPSGPPPPPSPPPPPPPPAPPQYEQDPPTAVNMHDYYNYYFAQYGGYGGVPPPPPEQAGGPEGGRGVSLPPPQATGARSGSDFPPQLGEEEEEEMDLSD
ncbi:hypothetical protein B0H17DRAFT_1192466 [Mycena rosella]|uniref:CCHC-type domain-containing protein n=1 Tax=Mycena rosella TaxID=1033263 RepID=A0AAD7GWP2_MYCRO|nr:hypothetical protein B0H17DRAFT_1192466 [Mycena rosella]